MASDPRTRAGSARDRDDAGRARSARARDGLGRPLAPGAEGVARQPEGLLRTPSQTITEAQALLDAGRPFHAHEVFEDAWKAYGREDHAAQLLWRGMAQLAVGLTHHARGNARGASALLRRGAANISGVADGPTHGLDVATLARWAGSAADEIDSGAQPRAMPRLSNPSPPATPQPDDRAVAGPSRQQQ
jgi:hypothetical protein